MERERENKGGSDCLTNKQRNRGEKTFLKILRSGFISTAGLHPAASTCGGTCLRVRDWRGPKLRRLYPYTFAMFSGREAGAKDEKRRQKRNN